MGNRLTKIYTRTGDAGDTGTADGSRIAKDDLLMHAIGDVDELNSQLALVACHAPDDFKDSIKSIQNTLFDVGAELAMLGMDEVPQLLDKQKTEQLEQALDGLNQSLPVLKEFILPGGGLAASHCHVARSVCRRAERSLVSLNRDKKLNADLMAYMNRLSDYLFVLARSLSRHDNQKETFWGHGTDQR
jgi:cob(I)alamin adenosyltransferase